MANKNNYTTDTTQVPSEYTRYTVSRVIVNKNDDLLSFEAPADFHEHLIENTVELNLYSLEDNSLIFSDVIYGPDALETRTVQYNDGTTRTLLFIDYTKLDETLLDFIPSGRYSITLNFFADEVGSYNNKILKINKISTSRNEVELKLTNTSELPTLYQFAIPRISVEYIETALKQIFNQPGAITLTAPMSSIVINSASLYQNFSNGDGERLVQYGFDVDNGTQLGINTITQNVLNDAYPLAKSVIDTKILASGSTSFTENELIEIVINAINRAYDIAIDDELRNPQNYRFDLI